MTMGNSSVFLLLTCLLAAHPQAGVAPPAEGVAGADISEVAMKYLAAERERQAEGATPRTVDAALAFLTDTVVYEHPRAGARITGKATLREGMLAFLGAVRNPRDEVVSKLAGPGVVVLQMRQSFQARRGKGWEAQTRTVVKVLEFDGEKIRRIIDYW